MKLYNVRIDDVFTDDLDKKIEMSDFDWSIISKIKIIVMKRFHLNDPMCEKWHSREERFVSYELEKVIWVVFELKNTSFVFLILQSENSRLYESYTIRSIFLQRYFVWYINVKDDVSKFQSIYL